MKLSVGSQISNFEFSTPYKSNIKLKDCINKEHTAIFFLRYYGCTLCQLKLHQLKTDYQLLSNNGIGILVALQSSPKTIRDSVEESFFPFDIVCDEDELLYKGFEIIPAATKLELSGGSTVKEIIKAKSLGFKHGEHEGNELQLPATFVIDKNLIITMSHYGKNGADILTTEEILSHFKQQ